MESSATENLDIRVGARLATAIATVLVFATTLGGATGLHAAESADMRIGGQIRPSACTIALSQDTIDFGTIPANSLSRDALTTLHAMPFQAVIQCDGPAVTALEFQDNRAGTEGDDAMSAQTWFGLGEVRGRPIGAFQIQRGAGDVVADGNGVQTIEFTRSGTWLQMNTSSPEVSARNGYLLSWSAAGTAPTAFTTVVVPLAVLPTLLTSQAMAPVAEGIALDGLATISLVYL